MKTYAYAARFEPMENGDGFVVTFDDVPEAVTEGETMKEAREMAADALGVALLTYIELGRNLPVADAKGVFVTPHADVAAKIAMVDPSGEGDLNTTDILDVAEARAVKARIDAGEETWPQELVDALLAGENPIRVFRKHRAMTVAVLAQQTGLSQPYISELENGKKSPSVKALQAIASALAVDLDDITS